MIPLRRPDLRELASILVLVNTPHSLYIELRKSEVLKELWKFQNTEMLKSLFNRITARARRTEISLAIGYALLIVITQKEPHPTPSSIDVSCLFWGGVIEDLTRKDTTTSQILILGKDGYLNGSELRNQPPVFKIEHV